METTIWTNIEIIDGGPGFLAIECWNNNISEIVARISIKGDTVVYLNEVAKTDTKIQEIITEITRRGKIVNDLLQKRKQEKKKLVKDFIQNVIFSGDYGKIEELLMEHVSAKDIRKAM